jgi:anti-sigma28 factor (negative regulator of flagellin synthesis)
VAFDIYYSSKLARQIESGEYGIENMDAKYLAEDLIENEPELFR